ncbi:MAG: glycogen/starch/alpha-glucan phosphorylase [Gammaproteobacteria bacterium]|nr:glycogen/starch/alpha-glucan phosphorylase [Gammaproteobacteria bacterium]
MPNRTFIPNKLSKSLTDVPVLGMDKDSLITDIKHHYSHSLARDKNSQSIFYVYSAVALTVRDRLMERWKDTHYAQDDADSRTLCYLSLEYLMGRSLGNALINLGIRDEITDALKELGFSLDDILDIEPDAGLGNGGLGRLAACFIDSCATLQLPVRGYGIRYEYGMFRQEIHDGHQIEEPDRWLRNGHVWEIERPELTRRIKFGGRTEIITDNQGNPQHRWVETRDVLAIPYDVPIPGFNNNTVNTLRLWKAEATDEFNLGEFNAGDYTESVAEKNLAENITMVLYPNDASENGKELRLRQQYFLASASVQDKLHKWVLMHGENFQQFAEKNCFQLNDTHPTIAIPELMRLLMDHYGLNWDQAWDITSRTMAYTNHTLLPEALERWPVRMLQSLLPRILEIILEINARFLAEVSKRWPGQLHKLQHLSIVEEGNEQQIRMAYLAIVGSFSVNGVAQLHTDLLESGLFQDFYELWPHKFNNKTNGVTPRRWIALSNPALTSLLNSTIGEGWVTDLTQLEKLKPYASKAAFHKKWREVKQQNKIRLQQYIETTTGIQVSPDMLFDVQVKRIHEYKRQLLNVLHVIYRYNRIKQGHTSDIVPRCVIIGGKAAPGYVMAKLIIKLIHNVADVINNDPQTRDMLKLVFIPNYRVSAMEVISPGTDLSEQISTAGKEASGTGNMKLMMNGALTIGTYDGANIEIREEAGEDNFFLFGLNESEVQVLRSHYDPQKIIESDTDLKNVMGLLNCGHFNQYEPGLFNDIINALYSPYDPWMTIADFRSFVDMQHQVDTVYKDQKRWTEMTIINCATSGKFSSDRTILDYNRDIWNLPTVKVKS